MKRISHLDSTAMVRYSMEARSLHLGSKGTHMENVQRIIRVVEAALQLVRVETQYSLSGSSKGAKPAKRELAAAVDEYFAHHGQGVR
jgi:hypothetical protein